MDATDGVPLSDGAVTAPELAPRSAVMVRVARNARPKATAGALLLLLYLIPLALNGARAEQQINREFRECADCPEMVAVPGGRFVMGSPAGEPGRLEDEGPQHRVSLQAFAIGKYDVTNVEFLTFLRETGYQPSPCNPLLALGWGSPGQGRAYPPGMTDPPLWPATCLNWNDAEAYINWLNRKVHGLPSAAASKGGPYRLPSEAEWEYAARAETATARWWGNAIGVANANCDGCGSRWDDALLAPVGTFGPNPFGLYDMLGNAWQWVDDCWNESYVGAPNDGGPWIGGDCSKRVLRGGSWSNPPVFVRSAARSRADAAGADFDYSIFAAFRVARTLP